jgi:hypothetical protein
MAALLQSFGNGCGTSTGTASFCTFESQKRKKSKACQIFAA